MHLKFEKTAHGDISIKIVDKGEESEFSYIDMIQGLINDKKLNEPVIIGDFLAEEKQSLNSMINYINSKTNELLNNN